MQSNAPGTYIREQPGAWAPEPSGSGTVAAFIGYTEKGPRMKPVLVHSPREYEKLFGPAAATRFDVAIATPPGKAAAYALSSPPRQAYYLYHSIQLYFANGGALCRVVSVGSHADAVDVDQLVSGLDLLAEQDVDLLVPADAAQLPSEQYYRFCRAMLAHCKTAKDRLALMDLQDSDTVAGFRTGLGSDGLSYGAAFSPYLESNLPHRYTDNSVSVAIDGAAPVPFGSVTGHAHIRGVRALLDKFTVTLPPGGAVAGVYAKADRRRGVWRPVSDIPLKAIAGPKTRYGDADQAPMNVDAATGKSINAIRSFRDRGTVLWGARTLDGNSDKWRYVAARRLYLKLERDIKAITAAAAGAADIARTRTWLKTVITSYLDDLWRAGALSGTAPSDAYYVRIDTGTGSEEPGLNVRVGAAVFRPAEFITVTFTY